MMLFRLRTLFALTLVSVLASSPTSGHVTKEEIQKSIESQSSIYHCYPEILSQLEARRSAHLLKKPFHVEFVDQSDAPTASKFNTLGFGSSHSNDPFHPDALTCTRATHPSMAKMAEIPPVVRAGPYYHQEGHTIRQDLTEWQDGLPLLINGALNLYNWREKSLDIGVIDVETCQPIEGALVDIWHANATGFYAGHPSPMSSLENEKPQVGGVRAGLLTAYPRKNFHEQWLRGAWPTNANGVARFSTIFPGHYTGRATHIHAEVHMDWKTTANGTFTSKDVQYIGQFFFEDEINISVDKMWPYSQNPVKDRTRNWRDSLKVFQESRLSGFHPILEIHKLGSVINQGLVGFITVGIKRSNQFDHHFNPTSSDYDF